MMDLDLWLRIGAICLPLISALVIWSFKEIRLDLERWFVVTVFGIVALFGLTLFLLNHTYACSFRIGPENCLFGSIAVWSLIVLNFMFAKASTQARSVNAREDFILMLLLCSAWAGITLAMNILVVIACLNLLLLVVSKWFRREGYQWRLFAYRDEDDDKRI
jgi:hypothetical protein